MKLTLKLDLTRLIDAGVYTNTLKKINHILIENAPFVPERNSEASIEWALYIEDKSVARFLKKNYPIVSVGQATSYFKKDEVVVHVFLHVKQKAWFD